MNKLVNVVLEEKDGIVLVSSRIIAEQLGKEHGKVLLKIRDVLTKAEYGLSEYKDQSGKVNQEYLLSKDGFVLLVMNYQGYNEFKRAYIDKFNEMEKALQQQTPQTYIQALEETLRLAKANEQLLIEAKENQPKIEFFNAVADSKTAIDIGQRAKILELGIGRNKLFEWLRDRKILMNNNQPYQRFIDKGLFRMIEQKYNRTDGSTHISIKTLVYQKGLNYIRKMYLEEFVDAAIVDGSER